MIKKHFVASEQAALRTFNGLNGLVKKGLISILGENFTCYEDMLSGPVCEEENYRWPKRRNFIFIHRKPSLGFAVMITVISPLASKADWVDDWQPEKVIVGRLNYYHDSYGDGNWKIVEIEEIKFFPGDPSGIKKLAGTPIKKFLSLKKFIKSNA